MILKELKVGDKFINIKNPKEIFIVRGNPAFNRWHGSATRVCLKLPYGELVSKSCRIQVKKVGESKEAMIQKPINFI